MNMLRTQKRVSPSCDLFCTFVNRQNTQFHRCSIVSQDCVLWACPLVVTYMCVMHGMAPPQPHQTNLSPKFARPRYTKCVFSSMSTAWVAPLNLTMFRGSFTRSCQFSLSCDLFVSCSFTLLSRVHLLITCSCLR